MTDYKLSLFYETFATLLAYPGPLLPQRVSWLVEALQKEHAQAALELAEFEQYIDQVSLEDIEELYTRTFDLQGVCYPYIGHQLFGESYKRSWFMSSLNGEYQRRGFTPGNELPDHLVVILDFLACSNDDQFCQALVTEGLLAALPGMIQSFGDESNHPYLKILMALMLLLNDFYLPPGQTTLEIKIGKAE